MFKQIECINVLSIINCEYAAEFSKSDAGGGGVVIGSRNLTVDPRDVLDAIWTLFPELHDYPPPSSRKSLPAMYLGAEAFPPEDR